MTSAYNVNLVELPVASSLNERIADLLRGQINSGKLEAGTRLKGENELASEFSVSRPTIRHALARLQSEGLLVKRHGLGSFVQLGQTRQISCQLKPVHAEGASPVQILSFNFEVPEPRVRTALGLAKGASVLSVHRVHFFNRKPIAFAQLCIPEELGATLSRDELKHQPVCSLLASRSNVTFGRVVQTLRVVAPAQDVAQALQLTPDAWILLCDRVLYSEADQPVLHAFYSYPPWVEFQGVVAPYARNGDWLPPGMIPQTPDPA